MQIILLEPLQVRVSHKVPDKSIPGGYTVDREVSKTHSAHFGQKSTFLP